MTFNSDNFNLLGWKLTLPVSGSSGNALEVKNLAGFEQSTYFYDSADGGMVFRADTTGATTSGSRYPRSELREMAGSDLAWWTLADGGTMSGTLKVDAVPVKTGGVDGRLIFAQIHGTSEELLRMYWENGSVYFVNDQSGPSNNETNFYFANAKGEPPRIAKGEVFSYLIDVQGDTMSVQIFADGQTYSSVSKLSSVWQSDEFYFKAGVYLGVNSSSGTGSGQVSYYGLDYSHTDNGGLGGIKDGSHLPGSAPTPTPDPIPDPTPDTIPDPTPDPPSVPTTPTTPSPNPPATPAPGDLVGTGVRDNIAGTGGNDRIFGLSGDDMIKGRAGNDTIFGGSGNDTIEGNDGNDTIIGGVGADKLKGGSGADTFVIRSTEESGDTIADFRAEDKLDLGKIFAEAGVHTARQAIDNGLLVLRNVGGNVEVWANVDGGHTKLATMTGIGTKNVQSEQIVVNTNWAVDSADSPVVGGNGSSPQAPASSDRDGTHPTAGSVIGTTNDDTMTGNALSNRIYGMAGNDKIKGNAGDDVIFGGAGADRIEGNDGNDRIVGGSGNDWMKGGSGADHFIFGRGDGVDTLHEVRADDTIVLEDSRFTSAAQALSAVAEQGGKFVLQYSENDHLVFTDTSIAQLQDAHWLFSASDLVN